MHMIIQITMNINCAILYDLTPEAGFIFSFLAPFWAGLLLPLL